MELNRKISIMGIVNLTDDSYFAESRCANVQAAIDRIAGLVAEGADIIDIGACSTRPGSLPVGAEEEWRRLEPVLAAFRSNFQNVTLSIDTYWASVVEKAFGLLDSFIVNDISAGEADPDMLPTVGRLGLKYVAMHMRGTPENMQQLTDYKDVVEDVLDYFKKFSKKAEIHGISDWILDPGFGFAKTLEQNYALMRGLEKIKSEMSPRPILVGLSRKSMIYRFLGITPEESLPATQALHMAALERGADILRVHDVAEAVRTVSLFKMLS
ncbi:MAG: dihydropteroate synthase [Bacteroidales bacterium]|nr:dihydropteroate synthase [Bacteroidales bacterium]